MRAVLDTNVVVSARAIPIITVAEFIQLEARLAGSR